MFLPWAFFTTDKSADAHSTFAWLLVTLKMCVCDIVGNSFYFKLILFPIHMSFSLPDIGLQSIDKTINAF